MLNLCRTLIEQSRNNHSTSMMSCQDLNRCLDLVAGSTRIAVREVGKTQQLLLRSNRAIGISEAGVARQGIGCLAQGSCMRRVLDASLAKADLPPARMPMRMRGNGQSGKKRQRGKISHTGPCAFYARFQERGVVASTALFSPLQSLDFSELHVRAALSECPVANGRLCWL